MVSNCANPACSAIFRYLYDGQLFHLPVQAPASAGADLEATPALESFWLCTECSRKMTLVSGPAGVLLVPLQHASKLTTTESGPQRPHSYSRYHGR